MEMSEMLILNIDIQTPSEMDWVKCIGRGEETRTPGLLLPKQVRYQLRYSPRVQIVPRITYGNGLARDLSRRTIGYPQH